MDFFLKVAAGAAFGKRIFLVEIYPWNKRSIQEER